MKIDMEFKKGVLFIRIKGILIGSKINDFEEEVIPTLLALGSRAVTVNVSELSLIDNRGLEALIKLSGIVHNNGGKLAICEINDSIKDKMCKSDIFDYCFKTKSELSSLGVFSI